RRWQRSLAPRKIARHDSNLPARARFHDRVAELIQTALERNQAIHSRDRHAIVLRRVSDPAQSWMRWIHAVFQDGRVNQATLGKPARCARFLQSTRPPLLNHRLPMHSAPGL